MSLAERFHVPQHAPAIARREPASQGIGPPGVALAVGGVGLIASALARRGLSAWALGLGGAALFAAGVSRHGLIRKWTAATPFERELADKSGWRDAAAIAHSVTILKPRDEVYAFWRELPNLARVMEPIEEIRQLDDEGKRTRWIVKAAGGRRVSWTATITEDDPGRKLAWESTPSARVRNRGWVEFRDAPNGLGTELHATIIYEPPGGRIGRLIARLTGREPKNEARNGLRQLKQLMELGEVATSRTRRGD